MLFILTAIVILQLNTAPVKANFLRNNDVKKVEEHRKVCFYGPSKIRKLLAFVALC
jgi:hypothetical protein